MVIRYVFVIALGWSSVVAAQSQPAVPNAPSQADPPATFEDHVVVSASRVEEQVIDAPATVSVVTAETIQKAPSAAMADLLRVVPGVNVAQLSARDVNITTRSATSALATSQLALVDGRTIYLDFFGMVMWDLVPTDANDIRRIEVIRGPASAVWGANALSGLVNVVTVSPRESAARGPRTTVTLTAGMFDRTVDGRDDNVGSMFTVNATHARAANDRWSYRVSAGYAAQDPLPRPAGLLPSGTPYPAFANADTRQPKFVGRADYELSDGGRVTMEGGVGGTAGIIHTGIGPADIARGSRLGYVAARYEHGGRRVAAFANLLHGEARTLLSVGLDRQPIPLDFDTTTVDFEAGDVRPVGRRHVLSYGANYRHNAFDISLAPSGDDRHEGGGYVEDEILISDHFRWIVGGRLDKFSSIDGVVFSPRTTFLMKPSPSQTLRASVNRAFRSPSLVNNSLDITVVTPVMLPVVGVFAFPTRAVGDPHLKQETLTAYEVGYSGIVARRALVSAAVYWNHTDEAIRFTPVAAYSSSSPPPGWPLPPQFVPQGALPARYSYVNLGTVEDKGLEVGVDAVLVRSVTAFANYSHQWRPVVDFPAPFSVADVNWPAANRINAGFSAAYRRYLASLTASFTDEAYWQDVLDARFAGRTDSYTLINASFGVKWAGDRVVTSIKAINLANRQVMQHLFGDVLKRQVIGEVRVGF
jgi:outer membrane receptor for ferrienterochelin and colicin